MAGGQGRNSSGYDDDDSLFFLSFLRKGSLMVASGGAAARERARAWSGGEGTELYDQARLRSKCETKGARDAMPSICLLALRQSWHA